MKTLAELQNMNGRVALVTGGAGYLGQAICETLAELGASVMIASRNLDQCQAAADELGRNHPESSFWASRLDVTSVASIHECVSATVELGGRLDVLVNNAWSGKKNSWESISEEDWVFDVDISLTAAFRMVKAAYEHLQSSRGVILNVSSMYGRTAPNPDLYFGNEYSNPPSYGAAKAGLLQFTRYLASFLAESDIRANALSPGAFPHDGTQEDTEFIDRLSSKNPANRIGYPEDLKGAVALLVSDAGAYMTGQNVCVDGGWTVW